MSNYNFSGPPEIEDSILATVGNWMSHLSFSVVFDTEAGAAVLSGIMAKETVVATIGILYGAGDVSTEAEDAANTATTMMQTGMATAFTSLSAFAFMVFSQLYTPCGDGARHDQEGSGRLEMGRVLRALHVRDCLVRLAAGLPDRPPARL